MAEQALSSCDVLVSECDVNWTALILLYGLPLTLAMLAAGIGVAKVLHLRTPRRPS
jgi:hypothetical protein